MSERVEPEGKALFYRSVGSDQRGNRLGENVNVDETRVAGDPVVTSGAIAQKVALYDQLSDSIEQVLDNSIRLLELANKTWSKARGVAESTLDQTRVEQNTLLGVVEKLTRERDELRLQVRDLRDEVCNERESIKALEDLRDSLHAEIEQLEERHRQATDGLQTQLAAINRLQETLRFSSVEPEPESEREAQLIDGSGELEEDS